MNDPFENGPIRLGFNTLVPTVLGSAYKRGSFSVNADGSFALAWIPDVVNTLRWTNAGAATPTWANIPSTNSAALQQQMSLIRVVSGGLRLFVTQATTSPSGVLYAGSSSAASRDTYTALTPTTLSDLASSELEIGYSGAAFTSRPIDISAVEFSSAQLTGFPNNAIAGFTTGYVCGLNFPSTAVVYYESILNVEGLPTETSGSIGISSSTDFKSTPANEVGSFERAYNYARSFLMDPVIMDAAAFAVGSVNQKAGAAVGLAGRFARRAQHVLVAGQQAPANSRQSTVVIEEMKADELRPSQQGRWIRA